MKKITLMAFLLALLTPIMGAWAHSTHYGKMKVVASGAGTVYLSTDESGATSGDTEYPWNCGASSSKDSATRYCYAVPDLGYKFAGWTGTGISGTSSNNPYKLTLKATGSQSSPTTATLTAKFEERTDLSYQVKFLPAENGSYTAIDASETDWAGKTTPTQNRLLKVTLSAQPAENFLLAGFYTTTDDGANKTYLTSPEVTLVENISVGVDFIPDGVVIYAAKAKKGYDDLATALKEAENGERISVYENVELNGNAVLPVGVTLSLEPGVTVTVNGTLAVAGTVAGAGTIAGNGTLYKVSYLINQSDVITIKTAYGKECEHLNFATDAHYDKMPRYCRTEVAKNTPTVGVGVSMPSDKQSWGVLLNGASAYAITTRNPVAVKVSVDTTKENGYQKAVNKITSVIGTVLDTKLAETANYVLFSDCSLTGPLESSKLANQSVVDCAGHKISATVNTHYKFCTLCLNGTVYFSASQWQNAKAAFFNCSSIEIHGIKNVSPSYAFYDCGSETSPCVVKFGYYTETRTDDYRKAAFYSGCYDVSPTFNDADDGGGKCTVYGGSYTSKPIGVPTAPVKVNNEDVEIEATDPTANGTKYWVVEKKEEKHDVAAIGSSTYPTLEKAIKAAEASGSVITLQENIALEENAVVTIPDTKSITIVLNGRSISGGKIVNNGTLLLTDTATANCTTVLTLSGGAVASTIENNKTLDIVWGCYKGAIVNNATGAFTVSNGRFEGLITNNGGAIALKGGHFKKSVFAKDALVGLGVVDTSKIVTSAEAGVDCYTVCAAPNGDLVHNDDGYAVTPFNDDEYSLLLGWIKGKNTFASYSTANWKLLAQLLAFYQAFNGNVIDAALSTDRDVVAGTLELTGSLGTRSYPLSPATSAGVVNRVLSSAMVDAGWSAMAYKYTFTHELGPFKTVGFSAAIKGADGANNNGTVCRVGIELWSNNTVVYTFGQKVLTIGAGSNKAMIRPATGAATFYATLGGNNGIVNAVADCGTIMLANNCAEDLVLTKVGTYTFDTMGFAYTGATPTAADGLFVKSTADADSEAKIIVPNAVATTYVVAQKVAGVGAQFYDNLTEAVTAANGATVTLLAATDETITLGEGQSFTLNKNGIAFDDAKVTTSVEGYSVKAEETQDGTLYTVVQVAVEDANGNSYATITEAIENTAGDSVEVTVTAPVNQEIEVPQGKTVTVTIPESVEATVTIKPVDGLFVVTETTTDANNNKTTTYEAKQITEVAEEITSATAANIKVEEVSAVGETNAVEAVETIVETVNALMNNKALERADNTAKTDVLKEITVVPSAIVRVVDNNDKAVVKSAAFDVTPKDANGDKVTTGDAFTFRLPVDAAVEANGKAIVRHEGAFFGLAAVQAWSNYKFIEVTSSAFSEYSYEILDGETANPVAIIGTTGYASLAAAVAAAPTDGTETTITMLAGETLSSSVTFPANTKIVLDLNGQTINNQTTGFAFASGTSPARFTFIVNGDLTVKDSGEGGNISIAKINQASPNSTKAFYVNGKLTVESGTISADYSAAYVNANAEMVVNGGVVHGDSYGININKSNGHVTINGGKVTAAGEATLCTNGNEGIENLGIFDINGGTIENTGANGTAIYNPNRGTVINVHAPATITGATAIVMKGGTINIDGGTVTGTGAFGAPGAANSGFKPTGDALYVEDTYSTNNNNFKPTVNITGGTFTSANGYAAQYYTQAAEVTESQANGSINVSGTATLTSAKQADAVASTEIPNKVNVSGGSFTHAVPEEYCADGYIPATQDPETGLYTVKEGSYVAQIGDVKYETFAEAIEAANAAGVDEIVILNGASESPDAAWEIAEGKLVRTAYVAMVVRNSVIVEKYETLDAALAGAESGDTVQLLADITGVTATYNIDKALTIDGQGKYKIVAGANSEPRNVIAAWSGPRVMFDLTRSTANVTFKDITLDNGEGHYYSYFVRAKNGTATFEDVALLRGAEKDSSGTDGAGYGAAILADGGNIVVKGDFYADTHGEPLEAGETGDRTAGIFPFTAILYQGGGIHFDDGTTADIGQDLLLVGMQRALDLSDETTKAQVQDMLDAMNVPAGYVPYTLKVADSEQFTFTGASPRGWNDIIDYGKGIMDVSSSLGIQMDKTTTPVEVGLIADTVLPDEFTYEDANFTINGNGNALSGTIEYTDNAGTMENVVMGTEEAPLVLDMTGLSEGKSINLGTGIAATNVTIKVTEEQAATQGQTIVTWNTEGETAEESAAMEAGIKVEIVNEEGETIVDEETGNPQEASLVWDAEVGRAYIGPCEARLTTVDANNETAYIYTSLARAIELARNSGDTVTLMMDIENFTGTQEIYKNLVLDGAGHKIAAKPVTTHRNVVNAFLGGTTMLKIDGPVTVKNITIDGDASHAYTYLVSADNGNAALTTENITLLHGGELCGDENGNVLEAGAGYGAAIHLNNGASIIVKDGFYADTHGAPAEEGQTVAKADGVFPFTGILPEGGSSVKFMLTDDTDAEPTVAIGEDLLLVGMVGAIDSETAQGILDYMKVPSRFRPYTLTLGDGSAYAFTGASLLGWNEIIDYGKEIMVASTAVGYQGLDTDETPVEVGLLTDTELPDTFTYEDSNFTVNGNGNALSGTIKYTDEAGIIENIVLGTEEKPLILDLREVTDPVEIGNLIGVTNVTVLMTAEQATLGQPVFTWNVETAGEPDNAESVKITVLESADVPYDPEEEAVEKGLVWDDELGIAYIGPCEARLTGPEREPGYMDLTNAFNMAVGGDTVTLFWSDVTLNEEIGLPAGTLLFATNKYELALGQDAAFVFTNATTVFRSEMAFSTDIITLAGDVGNGYFLRTATDGTTNVYTVVQRGEYNVTGKTEAGADGTAVIKVSDEWIVANMNKASIAEIKTINEVEEYLDSRDSTTGMRKWENYVLKQTENPFRVSGIAANGALSTTLSDTPEETATTGFTVQYALNEVEANGTVKTAGTKSDGHNFSVAVDSVAGSALYKVRAYLTSGESTLVVDSTNTLGVLKVQPTIARSIVAVPWKSLRTGGDITVADYIRAADLSAGDKLHVYNGSSYDTWTYSGSNWSAVKTFIAGKEGTDTKVSGSAETTTLARGTGVWLERASGTAANLYLIGEYTPEPVETPITAGSASAMSWNLVGSPSVEAIDLNAAFGAPANAADRIVVPMPNGLQRNYTYKNGKWGYSDARKLANGRVQTFHNTENSVLPAGTGFWYLNAGDGRTIQW